jgi:hypothetical protein
VRATRIVTRTLLFMIAPEINDNRLVQLLRMQRINMPSRVSE